MLKDVGFSLTADSGELEWQAVRLVRSIRAIYPEAPVIVFVPDSGWKSLSDSSRRFFKAESTVVHGEISVPEYPISAMVQAMVVASERVEAEYLVGLDTDVVVVDELAVPSAGESKVWLRPAEVGAKYWCSSDADSDWRVLYDAFGVDVPESRVTTTIDKQRTMPFYNSGMVVTTDYSLPAEWLDITERLVWDESLPIESGEFFIDQIALAIAVKSRNVVELGEMMNYPLGGRVRVSSDVRVLHYGDTRNLGRILNPDVRSRLREIDALPSVSLGDVVMSGLVVGSSHCGRVLSYSMKERVRRWVEHLM